MKLFRMKIGKIIQHTMPYIKSINLCHWQTKTCTLNAIYKARNYNEDKPPAEGCHLYISVPNTVLSFL